MGSAVPAAEMIGQTPLLLLLLPVSVVLGQRNPPRDYEDNNRGNRLGAPSGRPNLNVGVFPFPRGETPISNFDQGDEGFIATIPELIRTLDAVKDTVDKQRKITQAFGEAFAQCASSG